MSSKPHKIQKPKKITKYKNTKKIQNTKNTKIFYEISNIKTESLIFMSH